MLSSHRKQLVYARVYVCWALVPGMLLWCFLFLLLVLRYNLQNAQKQVYEFIIDSHLVLAELTPEQQKLLIELRRKKQELLLEIQVIDHQYIHTFLILETTI